MGREVRMVSKDWIHPRREDDPTRYKSLFEFSDYQRNLDSWNEDLKEFIGEGRGDEDDYREYAGEKPNKHDYMPKQEGELYYMMYECTSEGTPISPAFKTPEELARWLTDNKASSFGMCTATYEEWLNMIHHRTAPSAVRVNGQLMSGVEGLPKIQSKEEKQK